MYFTKLRKLIFKHLTFLLWSLIFYLETYGNILNSGKKLSGIRPYNSEYPAGYQIVPFCHYLAGLSGKGFT